MRRTAPALSFISSSAYPYPTSRSESMGLLDGKKGLIFNIANDRSIATAIATNAAKQGATIGVGFLPMDNREKSERRARKAMEEGGFSDAWLYPCDVGSDESIADY